MHDHDVEQFLVFGDDRSEILVDPNVLLVLGDAAQLRFFLLSGEMKDSETFAVPLVCLSFGGGGGVNGAEDCRDHASHLLQNPSVHLLVIYSRTIPLVAMR